MNEHMIVPGKSKTCQHIARLMVDIESGKTSGLTHSVSAIGGKTGGAGAVVGRIAGRGVSAERAGHTSLRRSISCPSRAGYEGVCRMFPRSPAVDRYASVHKR